jgi:hypothetical protein
MLGADHYQVMMAKAVVRFWTLVACLTYFLDEQRAIPQVQQPGVHITLGDIRRRLQAEHQRNLLIWWQEQFRSGVPIDELCVRLKA